MCHLFILIGTVLMCITVAQLYAAPWEAVVFEDSFTGSDGDPPELSKWVIGHPEHLSGWFVQGRSFIPAPSQQAGATFTELGKRWRTRA